MTSPPAHLTFSFDSPSGPLSVALSAASDELLTLVAPLDTPNAPLAVLFAAALTWCNERPGFNVSMHEYSGHSTVAIAIPRDGDWNQIRLESFVESFKAGLLNVGKPASELITDYGTLAYYPADEAHPQDTLRFLSLTDTASQAESFAAISGAAAQWNGSNPHNRIACTRVNGILTITAISGNTFSEFDIENVMLVLRPSTHRALKASAAPMPVPHEAEPVPPQPPSIPINLPGDEEGLKSVGA